MTKRLHYTALATVWLTTACSLTPDASAPELAIPQSFKEVAAQDADIKGEWKAVIPLEEADRGQWWRIFEDADLDALESEALLANQSLKAAAARVEQARATVRASASTLFPTIDIGGGVKRSQPSSAGTAAFGGNPNAQLNPHTLYGVGALASYEVDLFGRVRDNEKALKADAAAMQAMYNSTLLALQADVAQHYFNVRALDAERQLLRDTVVIRTEAARIMQKRFDVGEGTPQDLKRAQAELAATQAELLSLDQRRAVLEHALAVLLGKAPADFTFAEAPLDVFPPEIPAGLPSSLLARRPDISAAIANMEAANRRIGVARTAFFPRLVLSASGGFESLTFPDLFHWSARTWTLGQAVGDALSMTIFDSGRNIARVDIADAAYQETVANYQAQALAAFRDVEDALVAQRLLAGQAQKIAEAAEAAVQATNLTQTRYDEGDANYFEVVDAQRQSLAAERADVQIRGQRLLATVALIRALGGGWDEDELVVETHASPAALDALLPGGVSPEAPMTPIPLMGSSAP